MRRICVAFLTVFLFGVADAATCPDNQYVSNGACVNCIYNATCEGEHYTCVDGFYDTGDNECAACPPNTICTSPTDFICAPGSYLLDGVCSACPAHATCAGGNEKFQCDDGWYVFLQQCYSCKGHVCENGELKTCGEGYYHLTYDGGVNTRCNWCSAGFYCPPGTPAPTVCKAGYYKDGSACIVCPDGYYCPQSDSHKDYRTYCAVDYHKVGNVCEKCPDDVTCVGTYPDNMTCPDGLYLHDDGRCLPWAGDCSDNPDDCNVGCYSNGQTCVKCPVDNSVCESATDFSCNTGYYKQNNQCKVCPVNATCNDETGILCDGGYELVGETCKKCAIGQFKYCENNVWVQCPEISIEDIEAASPEGHKFLRYSRAATYASSYIASSVNTCFLQIGYFSALHGEYVRPDMFWNGTKYWPRYTTLYYYRADPGYYLSGAATLWGSQYYTQLNQCTNAPANAVYTDAGTPGGNDCPWVCDAGYLRNGNTCTECPAGYTCINGLLVCPLGQYAVGMTCSDCPPGYIARSVDNIAPQSINECQIECAAGTYLSAANGTTCDNVGNGYWNAVNYTYYGASGARNACPAGLTTTGVVGAGADESADCGRVLHFGDYTLRLRGQKRTNPSLAVQVGDVTLYGDMSSEKRGHLRADYKDAVYSIFNGDID